MSAVRVPAGWTREAADAVWLDWQHAVGGSAGIRIWCFLALGPYPHLLTVDGYEIINPKKDREGRVLTGWTSIAARLRAWAAVGAPVLAPAEDGKASLAEWVAVFDERGLRLRCTWHDGSLGLWHFLPGAVVGWHSESDDIGPEGPMLYRDGCSGGDYIPTPVELRACLDQLAAEAQR